MSIKLHTLRPASGSIRKSRRIGRGQGSGRGGTSTRGHKGAQSRSGYSRKFGFEGGQQPLQRRVPKIGFNRPQKQSYRVINLGTLETLAATHQWTTISPKTLQEKGFLRPNAPLKVLGDGKLTKALKIEAHACSKTAKQAIEKAGGSLTLMTTK